VRELRLRIIHSDLSRAEREGLLKRSDDDQRRYIREQLPLSDLSRFLAGEMRFDVPVYAVWGNHEDVEVVKRFYTDEFKVDHLHVLHDGVSFHLDGLHIFGVGGNFLVGRKLFQAPIGGGGGRLWTVLSQYIGLLETVRSNARRGEKRILVSHVSPGKEPFVTLMGIHTASDLIISGHMEPPFSMIWNDFAVRSHEEATRRIQERLSDIGQAREAMDAKLQGQYKAAVTDLSNLPDDTIWCGRGQYVPAWYRNMFNVNLADASVGYALLETDEGTLRIHTKCHIGAESISEQGAPADADKPRR
jgi:hypothetical protein